MSLIIGVLGRPKTSDREFTSFSKAVTDAILKYKHIPLGIIAPVSNVYSVMSEENITKLHRTIDLCDGIILQGGTDYYQYDIEAIKYIAERNIPLLGICLGMQSMGVAYGAHLSNVSNHSYPGALYVHEVELQVGSKLHEIIGKDQIKVNSRHNEMVIEPKDIKIVGYCDQVIEALEKSDKSFFIGVQWHPEDMLDYDPDSPKIFVALFSACEKYHQEHPKM